MTDAPLLNWKPTYPCAPGARARDTSFQAADEITSHAATVRARVYEILKGGEELTADECAARLGETVLTVRPRCTELSERNLIIDTGIRRRNESGRFAIVWKIAE